MTLRIGERRFVLGFIVLGSHLTILELTQPSFGGRRQLLVVAQPLFEPSPALPALL
jgi:hypothetical protein